MTWYIKELNTKMHEGEEDWSNSDGGIIGMPASDSSPNHAVLPDMGKIGDTLISQKIIIN